MKKNLMILMLLICCLTLAGCKSGGGSTNGVRTKYVQTKWTDENIKELGLTKATGTETSTPKLKEKIAIAKFYLAVKRAPEMDRLGFGTADKLLNISDPVGETLNIFSGEVYAKSPDELDTLVKIQCLGIAGCDAEIINYKDKTLIAKFTPKDNEMRAKVGKDEIENEIKSLKDIMVYVKNLPLEP